MSGVGERGKKGNRYIIAAWVFRMIGREKEEGEEGAGTGRGKWRTVYNLQGADHNP